MAKKLTIKREKFCQEYSINGGNATEAYRQAFGVGKKKDSTLWKRASELLNRGEVQGRIKQIQQENNAKYRITVESMTGKILRAMQDYERPDEDDLTKVSNPSGLVYAAMQAAKLNGLLQKDSKPLVGSVVRMDKCLVDGKTNPWGVGEAPPQ